MQTIYKTRIYKGIQRQKQYVNWEWFDRLAKGEK